MASANQTDSQSVRATMSPFPRQPMPVRLLTVAPTEGRIAKPMVGEPPGLRQSKCSEVRSYLGVPRPTAGATG